MNKEVLIKEAERIISKLSSSPGEASIEAQEFLRVYSGEKSSFYKSLSSINTEFMRARSQYLVENTLKAFISFLERDLMDGISIERRAQIDVVSDFLSQATTLLDADNIHPAASVVIIGASLEEFLRNWLEEKGLTISTKKPTINTYCSVLREAGLITKQDEKDVTSWSGLRNYAAHGEWSEVADRARVRLMLEGVNLFMRKYGAKDI